MSYELYDRVWVTGYKLQVKELNRLERSFIVEFSHFLIFTFPHYSRTCPFPSTIHL